MTQEMCENTLKEDLWVLQFLSDQLMTQEMCKNAVAQNPWVLEHVPDRLMTQEIYKKQLLGIYGYYLPYQIDSEPERCVKMQLKRMPGYYDTCENAVAQKPWLLEYVPVWLMTQDMCGNAVEKDPGVLRFVPDWLMTQDMCENAVEDDPLMLAHVPDYYRSGPVCFELSRKAVKKSGS